MFVVLLQLVNRLIALALNLFQHLINLAKNSIEKGTETNSALGRKVRTP